ncbi:hypothetical protein [Sphingomonas baiyangensis]|uniref:Uncharacterized protein n=1 Tax=Sphingomonas baiyangensis TaxID=2572576 RepID=A0A4U1L0X6_9SPHN|nr:hypothetical protein [Sphingomonas baiyangensis]TKD50419.1 hypothetical protein FBR43_06315 [Sphingomonas baiyangensis]
MSTLAAALLLAAAQAGPTLAEVERMAPVDAGRAVLAGRDHRPIAAIEILPPGGLQPPATIDVDLHERPVRVAGGCERGTWRALFAHPNQPRAQARPQQVYRMTRVTLVAEGGCPDTGYVHVNPGLDAAAALRALSRLPALGQTRIACIDRTASGFCDSGDDALRAKLLALEPRVVTASGGDVLVWLGEGATFTEVRLPPDAAGVVQVERRIPAPA